ncbi:hypothetical protein ACFWPU_29940 [Streptomyces sp. NPDC058471]|uniref:hypothetical protein n=1 Tax=Streptomyces sp. NPDC058471 TaxID=3346516 RepID=UPI0036666EF7
MAALKRSANGKQLLLLAALLFGIVTMHTLGHPTGHSPSSTASMATHSSSAATDLSASHERGPEQDVGRHQMSETGATTVSASATASDPAMPGMDGMDPLSVCLAVLAALTLVLLLKAGLLRPGGFAVPVRPLARLLDGLRPSPPPPRILLSRLSVLRI